MQDRFDLPQLNELKERFKFDLEENEKIFDQIRNEISERLFTFTEKIIEPVIAGSDSYSLSRKCLRRRIARSSLIFTKKSRS